MGYELFSKRQQGIQGETPAPDQSETIPKELRFQVLYIWEKVWGEAHYNDYFEQFQLRELARGAYNWIERTLREEYGVSALTEGSDPYGSDHSTYQVVHDFFFETEDTDKVIDVIEVSFRYIDREIREKFRVSTPDGIPPDEAINQLNDRFREHSVSYQYKSGQIVKVDSQDIPSEGVKPAEELPNNTQQTVNKDAMNKENKKYFIGHGRSSEWLKLRHFLQNTLKLPYEEFNRVPQAGKITSIRLKEMLESCCMAFLVMTGEDKHTDGTLHARENVIHEIGLFQAQLGYDRAIILLEEGCEEFSNIEGLGQIRFSKGNIKETFGGVVEVLQRESII